MKIFLASIRKIVIFVCCVSFFSLAAASVNNNSLDVDVDVDVDVDGEPDFSYHLTLKRAPSYKDTPAFLYAYDKETGKVSLATYDGISTIDEPVDAVDFDNLVMLECGASSQFIARPGYVNHEDKMGTPGFDHIEQPCHMARNLETKWFLGHQLDVAIHYARDVDGNPMCYSLNEANCLWGMDKGGVNSNVRVIDDNATLRGLEQDAAALKSILDVYDEVRIVTRNGAWTMDIVLPNNVQRGKTVTIEVNSTWGVTVHHDDTSFRVSTHGVYSLAYVNGRWISPFDNINDDVELLLSARPLVCGAHHQRLFGSTGYDNKDHWCTKLASPEKGLHRYNVQEIIDSKLAHMDILFDQMLDWKLLKIDEDNNYISRLDSLNRQIDNFFIDDCGWWSWIFSVWWGTSCKIREGQYDDLVDEHDALVAERNAKRSAARTLVNSGKTMQWHELHTQWAQDDETHFAGLLKEESQSLDELKQLKEGYDKTAEDKHQAYLAAVQKYMDDTDPGNIVKNVAEDLPLVGPEISHIVDYAENPSSKNLRRMLLGLAGPVGEAAEGAIELATGDSELDSGEMNFLTDVLTDLGHDDSIGQALEDVVSDAINDLGDEAIEGLRQTGLWVDHPNDDPALEIDYAGVVDVRSRAQHDSYDPWADNSDAARQFHTKFTPQHFNSYNDAITDSVVGVGTVFNHQAALAFAPSASSDNDAVIAHMQRPLQYDAGSITDIEYASGGSVFNHRVAAIFAHSFGKKYTNVARRNPAYRHLSDSEINHELYKVLADPAYYEQRIPYWVDSSVLGQRPAGLLYDNNHAVIVLNEDLLDEATDWSKFYFEELGHLLNWWRCKLFDVAVSYCSVHGDGGARFRDAVLVDAALHEGPFEVLLSELPGHPEVDQVAVKFNNDTFGVLEGWPDYYTLNDHIVSSGKFSWLMRLGLDVKSDYPSISDEFDMEASIVAPVPAPKGDPWGKPSPNGYCETDLETDCNMPTMWVTISFRDAIKFSIASVAGGSNTGVDFSPRLVRKHGGKLPFQLTSVNGTDWKYFSHYNIYYKKFTVALEAKLDLFKMGHAIKGASVPSTHKPEFSFKATPVQGSYLVEIATRDTEDFAGWLAGDIASAVAGCAAGFAIGIVAEKDPVLFCHGFSDLLEIVETAFQFLDKKPTMIFEADGNVSLPSLEYKYATSGNKIRGNTTPEKPQFNSGRATYNQDTGTSVSTVDASQQPVTPTTNTQVTGFKAKAGRAFQKLGARSISPIAVFRFRVGFDYIEKLINEGEYNLPSVIVGD